MKVKIKKLSTDAVIPSYAKEGDAGLDITATGYKIQDEYIEYSTGLALQIPEGYVGLIYPRSSISNKDLFLANSVGVIDSGYRGEIKVRFKVVPNFKQLVDYYQLERYYTSYKAFEKIAQLVVMPVPYVDLVEVEELSNSERGKGGFGSTDAYAAEVAKSALHYKHNDNA